ncbi:uncharacterized protein LOC100833799 [Brachypodium distachyon]|nr:uncharacterized protein LOC100833799 [Brachypodium distachyon]KQJ94947.1 hypothetical protein BRADI_3g14270v3 [Brachypodium distachyon]|eukprot:XP_003571349.1 uncharacterized protein LOC100833799 [Brachypodium distachyon]
MDGSDLPAASCPTATTGVAGDGPPETAGEDPATATHPERCEALAAAIAGVLGGALEEHEARAAATARSQGELAAAIDRLNGELDKLLENAPSPVIAQHAARISSIRKRVLALNMLLRAIQRRIDNIDRMVSTGVTSDHPSRAQLQNHN